MMFASSVPRIPVFLFARPSVRPVRPSPRFMKSNIRRRLRNIIHFVFRIYRRTSGPSECSNTSLINVSSKPAYIPVRGHKHFRSCLFYVANIISYFILMWRPLWFKGYINSPLVLYIRNPVKYVCTRSSSVARLYIPLPFQLSVPVTLSFRRYIWIYFIHIRNALQWQRSKQTSRSSLLNIIWRYFNILKTNKQISSVDHMLPCEFLGQMKMQYGPGKLIFSERKQRARDARLSNFPAHKARWDLGKGDAQPRNAKKGLSYEV